jgi:4-hydroxy-2-oxoheptanedioate aldolase
MKHFNEMIDVLSRLRREHGAIAVKSEFEAEGTRLDEALLLQQVLRDAGLPLAMKIGGAEAVFDLWVAVTLGVNRIVGPMVESSYALKKFLFMCNRIVPRDHTPHVDIAINVETITAVRCMAEMVALEGSADLTGVVIGRNDLAGSVGRGREYVDSSEMFEMVRSVCDQARHVGWDTTIGGGVTEQSVAFIKRLGSDLLDRFETRKVIFSTADALDADCVAGIGLAVHFELLWLECKQDYYRRLSEEDSARIDMLQVRRSKMASQA